MNDYSLYIVKGHDEELYLILLCNSHTSGQSKAVLSEKIKLRSIFYISKNDTISVNYVSFAKIESFELEFKDEEQSELFYNLLSQKLNQNHEAMSDRYIAVLVNPISGKKRSVSYYNKILKPMLDIAKVKHDRFLTTSETFLEEWVNKINITDMPYTDFVIIGGDGLLFQLLNALKKHPNGSELLKFPIGIVPGGTQNAT